MPIKTSHNICSIVSCIKKINSSIKVDKLDIKIQEDIKINSSPMVTPAPAQKDSDKEVHNLGKLSKKSSIQSIEKTVFGKRTRHSDDSDSSFDEKISLVNGSLQRRKSYRPISIDILEE